MNSSGFLSAFADVRCVASLLGDCSPLNFHITARGVSVKQDPKLSADAFDAVPQVTFRHWGESVDPDTE